MNTWAGIKGIVVVILLSQENSFVFHETLPDSDKMLQLATPFPFMEKPRAHPK